MERALKELSLLVGGTLLGLLASLLLENTIKVALTIVVAVVGIAFALYGLSVIEMGCDAFARMKRNACAGRRRLVGILSDSDKLTMWSNKSSWTEITPDQWKDIIAGNGNQPGKLKPRLKPRMIELSKSIERYNVIINPYGGSYPEKDTVNHSNLDRIFEYVSRGGIFINVADLPGYWMYDVMLKTRIDATPATYGVLQTSEGISLLPIRPFEHTPFMERLAVRVENSSKYMNHVGLVYTCPDGHFSPEEIPKGSAERLAVVERNVHPVIVVQVPDQNEPRTPLFMVPYGRGKFIINLFFLDSKYPQNAIVATKLVSIMQRL